MSEPEIIDVPGQMTFDELEQLMTKTREKPKAAKIEKAVAQFTVSRLAMLDALKPLGRIIRPGPKPILLCVHIKVDGEMLVILGTNLEQYGKSHVTQVQIESQGEFCIGYELLSKHLASSSQETMKFRIDGDNLILSDDCSESRIPILPSSEFPFLPEDEPKDKCIVSAAEFVRIIQQSEWASGDSKMSIDGTILSFGGSKIRALSSDGKVVAMSIAQATCHGDGKAYVTRAFTSAVLAVPFEDGDSVEFYCDDRTAEARFGHSSIRTIQLEANTPDYDEWSKQWTPLMGDEISLSREEILSSVERCMIADDRILFTGSKSGLTLESESPNRGKVTLNVPCKSPSFEQKIAAAYIRNSLKCGKEDEAKMRFGRMSQIDVGPNYRVYFSAMEK